MAIQWSMALEGDVGTFPLADLFAWLARSRATGTLTLARGMTIRRFHLRRGRVRMVSSSEQEMLLGHLLVERRLLTREALDETLAGRGRSRARLGRLLMRGGLVSAEELQEILVEKVRRLLGDALTWSEGRFHYEAAAASPDRDEVPRRARRGEIAVAVDLKAALAQLRRDGSPAEAADSWVVVDDSDVIESLPAGRED